MSPMKVAMQAAEAQQLGKYDREAQISLRWTILRSINATIQSAILLYMTLLLISGPIYSWSLDLWGGGAEKLVAEAILAILTYLALLAVLLSLLGRAISKYYQVIQRICQRIYLFERGLVIVTFNQVQVFPWKLGTEIWRSEKRERAFTHLHKPSWTIFTYTFRRADGSQIELHNLTKDIDRFGSRALSECTEHLLPQALAAIESGQTLTFAPFSLNQQGINKADKSLPWSQVLQVAGSGYVKVEMIEKDEYGSHKTWEKAEAAMIPNYPLLIRVAEVMRRRAGGRG